MIAIEVLRQELLAELRHSPTLTRELAGLERLVAETYASRVAWELIQNADDAGATQMVITQISATTYTVWNNGRSFDLSDARKLTRSTLSDKIRGESIGYRGIGAKSMVGIASAIQIASPKLAMRFDRRVAAHDLGLDERDVPLMRLPYPASAEVSGEEHTTITLEGVTAWDSELERLTAELLLFLRSVRSITIDRVHAPSVTLTAVVDPAGTSAAGDVLVLDDRGSRRRFAIRADTPDFALAIPMDGDEPGRFVAFVPTEELSGSSVFVNADFDTDPSRTRLADTQRNTGLAEAAGGEIGRWLSALLSAGDDASATRLLPTTSLSIAAFSRASLSTVLQQAAASAFAAASDLPLPPAWASDALLEKTGLPVRRVSHATAALPAFVDFARAAEIPTVGALDVAAAPLVVPLTRHEALVTSEQVLRAIAFSPQVPLPADRPIWPARSGSVGPLTSLSVDDPAADELVLAAGQAGLSLAALRARADAAGISRDVFVAAAVSGVGGQTRMTRGGGNGTDMPLATQAVDRWRSAETQVANVLRDAGWNVMDVSRANVGWDLEASRNGERRRIEVKLVEGTTPRFSLTNNELVAAREHGVAYEIWLVRKADDRFTYGVIADPAQSMTFERVCRQWENQADVPDVVWRTIAYA